MAKANKKNKNKPHADRVRQRQEKVKATRASSMAENPFELKINHQKHIVLGRKLTKFDKGRPGVSRSRAINKRKETLLVEYQKKGRGNQFLDRRLGENDPSLSAEDKGIRRFALERKHHGQASVQRKIEDYDDEEEEELMELTHRGQSLAEIEKFNDPQLSELSEDDSDDDKGRIGANIVGEQHFGGFLKKVDRGGEGEGGVKKTHREMMEEIIAKSKKAKYERQSEKEKTLELTEKLDREWREYGWKEFEQFREAVKANRESDKPKMTDKPSVQESEKTAVDKYDMVVKQLQFEARGQPTDRMKSKEEVEREEAERRSKLEAERLRRMGGGTGNKKISKRVIPSADSLDDGFFWDGDLGGEKSKSTADDDKNETSSADENSENDNNSDNGSNNKSDSESDEGNEESDAEDLSGNETDDGMKSDNNSENEDSSGENSENGEAVNTGDIDENSSSAVDKIKKSSSIKKNDLKAGKVKQEKKKENSGKSCLKSLDNDGQPDNNKVNNKTKNKDITKSKIKEDFEQSDSDSNMYSENSSDEDDAMHHLSDLEESSSDEENEKKIEKMSGKKASDCRTKVSEEVSSKKKKVAFKEETEENGTSEFSAHTVEELLASFNSLAGLSLTSTTVRDMDQLTTELFQHAQKSSGELGGALLELLLDKNKSLFGDSEDKGNLPAAEKRVVLWQSILLLKLTHTLFPTSDRRHAVTTPAMLFLCRVLSRYRVSTLRDVIAGLFLVTLCLEYVALSKRYIPEAVNFLRGVLLLATDKPTVQLRAPFKLCKKRNNLLCLTASKSDYEPRPMLRLSEGFSDSPLSDLEAEKLKIDCVAQCLRLASCFSELYQDLPSYTEIFQPLITIINTLRLDYYHSDVQALSSSLAAKFNQPRVYTPLVRTNRRPQPMKTFAPKFEEKFDGRKKRGGGATLRTFNDKQRLMSKYKKELKGAKREIRKDQQFLASVKLQEQRDRDSERERKTKDIMSQLARQEGECKAINKPKKTKK